MQLSLAWRKLCLAYWKLCLAYRKSCLACKKLCLACRKLCLTCRRLCLDCRNLCLACRQLYLAWRQLCLTCRKSCVACRKLCLACRKLCLACRKLCLACRVKDFDYLFVVVHWDLWFTQFGLEQIPQVQEVLIELGKKRIKIKSCNVHVHILNENLKICQQIRSKHILYQLSHDFFKNLLHQNN